MSQFTVIGHEQQPFAGVVKPSHRVHAPFYAAHQVHHCCSLLWIAHRCDVAFRLVQQQVNVALRSMKKFSVHPDVIYFWVRLAPQFADDLPIDLHVAGRNELLGGAA